METRYEVIGSGMQEIVGSLDMEVLANIWEWVGNTGTAHIYRYRNEIYMVRPYDRVEYSSPYLTKITEG